MPLRYVAQPYSMTPRGEFSAGEQVEFSCAVDAENGGVLLSQTAACVVVFQQWVDDGSGLHEEPEILAIYGSPAVASAWEWERAAA